MAADGDTGYDNLIHIALSTAPILTFANPYRLYTSRSTSTSALPGLVDVCQNSDLREQSAIDP